ILILVSTLILLYKNFYINFLSNGIILYNGLLCIENYVITFILFILLLSSIIISINSVFSFRKIEYLGINKIIALIFNKNVLYNLYNSTSHNKEKILIKNYMSEQYRIIEYPLIILFCIIGAVFLMSSFDIISIFLSIELQ